MKQNTIPSREELYYHYITLNLSLRKVGEIYHKSAATVSSWLKNYDVVKGADDVLQSQRATCLERYGVEYPTQTLAVMQKRKETCIKKYGCDNVAQSNIIKQKIKNTCKEKYGKEFYPQTQGFREKREKTCLDKYGAKSNLIVPEEREKMIEASIAKYGDIPQRTRQTKEKTKNTCLEKYGVDNVSKVPSAKRKRAETTKGRYGVDNIFKLPRVRDAICKTLQAKYGVEAPAELRLTDETRRIISSKENLRRFIEGYSIKSAKQMSEDLGYSYSSFLKKCEEYGLYNLLDSSSVVEKQLRDTLASWGVKSYKTRRVIPPYEIDLYCPDYKVGIEFNGDYWHSTKHLNKTYHQDKSLFAEEKGVFIYHIFEYEWKDGQKRDLILSQLQNLFGINDRKIFARNTKLKEVIAAEKAKFLKDNHLQGNDKSSVRLGLYEEEELVSLMTFGTPRYNKEADWELLRFCSKKGCNVVGGASKIFKYFTGNYNGTIVSYSDISKTRGNLYKKLGFSFQHIAPPNYVWVGRDIKTRYQTQMKKERETMSSLGYLQVFNAGNKVWFFTK